MGREVDKKTGRSEWRVEGEVEIKNKFKIQYHNLKAENQWRKNKMGSRNNY